jgi:hypothetical protein
MRTLALILGLLIAVPIGCVVQPAAYQSSGSGTVLDNTVIFRVGSSVEQAKGQYYYDVANSGKTVFNNGDTVAWLAVVGNAYANQTITVELTSNETGETLPVFSEVAEFGSSFGGDKAVKASYFTVMPREREERFTLRLRIGGTSRDVQLVFIP